MKDTKPPAARPCTSRPRLLSDEYLKEVGETMLAQLSKAKPPSEPLSRKSEPRTAWESDVTPKPAHSLWDEEAVTNEFVRVAPQDKTDRVELLPPEAGPGVSLLERFKRLIGKLF